ncbi:MAG: putative membrane protein [Candidatus Nanosalina sp. J07AB43]|nr:MAG: putative membrane protein [Candidatus Nanosalina sp. J07AB43]
MDSIRKWFVVYLKGVAMGAADAVPGVSGGTIALITGIYERLIDALSIPETEQIKQGFKAFFNRDYQKILKLATALDIPFLSILGIGVISSLILVLNTMNFLLESYTTFTYGFFFGLILLSAVTLREQVYLSGFRRKVCAASGFSIAFFASGLGAASFNHSAPLLFLSGALAVSAMILPGVSGSLFLVVLGQYSYVSSLVSDLTSDFTGLLLQGRLFNFLSEIYPVLVFMSGGVVGILLSVNLVELALEKYRKASMTFLIALMVGALRSPLIQVVRATSGSTGVLSLAPEFSLGALIGGLAVFILDRNTADI